ncbi:hypothetical protein [Pedobacter jamesrossensis]|uniref:Uncharacterized protein n=1 Tax=Pedobacter jamesrossensis TaxID=1908238 RepID=A0ABV8NMY5_9SPHI
MSVKFIVPLSIFGIGCHNSNSNKGSRVDKVKKRITLSSSGIIDSTRSILNQPIALKKKLKEGKISNAEFKKTNSDLMATYLALYNSLSPADALIMTQYKIQKEKEVLKNSLKNTNAPRWE